MKRFYNILKEKFFYLKLNFNNKIVSIGYFFKPPSYKECMREFKIQLLLICKHEKNLLYEHNKLKELNKFNPGDNYYMNPLIKDYAIGLYTYPNKSFEHIIQHKIHILKKHDSKNPVFVLAHELGHHFIVTKEKRKKHTETEANRYILSLAKQILNKKFLSNTTFMFYLKYYSDEVM